MKRKVYLLDGREIEIDTPPHKDAFVFSDEELFIELDYMSNADRAILSDTADNNRILNLSWDEMRQFILENKYGCCPDHDWKKPSRLGIAIREWAIKKIGIDRMQYEFNNNIRLFHAAFDGFPSLQEEEVDQFLTHIKEIKDYLDYLERQKDEFAKMCGCEDLTKRKQWWEENLARRVKNT